MIKIIPEILASFGDYFYLCPRLQIVKAFTPQGIGHCSTHKAGLLLCPNQRHRRLPFRKSDKALRVKSRFVTSGMCSRFLYLCPGSSGYGYKSCNMQQTSLFEAQAQARPAIDVRATIQRKIKSLNLWLDTKSELYSRIAEFSVTRRLVIRINLVSLCLTGATVAVEQQPLFSTIAIACAGWLVYRLNKSEKEGGEK